MNDNALISLIISTIKAQEPIAGIADLPVKQAYQPRNQGVNIEPTAYLFKIGDKRYGFRTKTNVWDADISRMVHVETQVYESTFQISALAIQNPRTPSAPTASDILNSIAYILQSDTTIETFESQNVGILRVMDIRNPYFMDDKNRYEASPSFDFILTHKQIISSTAKLSQTTELQILTV